MALMTIYSLTPAPDERTTTLWGRHPRTKQWETWVRRESYWVLAKGGSPRSWGSLLEQYEAVTDIDPELSELTKVIYEITHPNGPGRIYNEKTAYMTAIMVRDAGWRYVGDDPAAEPC